MAGAYQEVFMLSQRCAPLTSLRSLGQKLAIQFLCPLTSCLSVSFLNIPADALEAEGCPCSLGGDVFIILLDELYEW